MQAMNHFRSFFQSVPLFRILIFLLVSGKAEAHRVSSVSLISYLDTEKNTYVLDVAMEVVPSEEQALNDQISPEDAAREFAEEFLVVMFDKQDQKPALEIHTEETSDEQTPEELRRKQVLTKLSGSIAEGAKEFMLYLDPRCPMAVVMVVIKDSQPSRRMQVILAGEYSRPVNVAAIVEGDPFVKAEEAAPAAPVDPAGEGTTPGASAEPGTPGPFAHGWRSVMHGLLLPILLVVAIPLLTLSRRCVFLQIAIVLVTVSLVCVLSAWRLIPNPTGAQIPLAILVAGLAVESLLHRRFGWWRVPLVLLAGIAAGFLIAGTPPFTKVFGSESFGNGEMTGFLLGVESALLVIALVSVALLLVVSRFPWYRTAVVFPLAALITGFSLFTLVNEFL
jgi:hypothetical protein